MAAIIYNGITYDIDTALADQVQSLINEMINTRAPGALIGIPRDGVTHRLFVTPGASITIVN